MRNPWLFANGLQPIHVVCYPVVQIQHGAIHRSRDWKPFSPDAWDTNVPPDI